MKKFGAFLCSLVVLVAMAIGLFFTANYHADLAYSAPITEIEPSTPEDEEPEEDPIVPEGLFNYVEISQQSANAENVGYIFGEDDFVRVITQTDEDDPEAIETTIFLYTNKTVSIYSQYEFAEGTRDGLSVYVDSVLITGDLENEHVQTLNDKEIYVFDMSNLEAGTEQSTHIGLSVIVDGVETSFSFNLVQIKNNYQNGETSWEYVNPYSNRHQVIPAPATDCTYPPMTLNIPNGTETNPTYVKFIYNGETFEVYNIGGVYYNSYVQTEEPGSQVGEDQTQPRAGEDNGVLAFSKLVFERSGTYTVEIYDKTASSHYVGNNHLTYNFTIFNQSSSIEKFYFKAHLETGEIIMYGQHVNASVIVDFVNIAAPVKNDISSILVDRFYAPTASNYTHEDYMYSADQIIDDHGSSLQFDDDGHYTITVSFDTTEGTQTKVLEFDIIKTIRVNYEIDDIVLTADPAVDPANTKITTRIDRILDSTYSFGGVEGKDYTIVSQSKYSFDVSVARSVPSIDGINNRARTSDNVNLVVRGVESIAVTVTKDGKSYTQTYHNGDHLQTFSEMGNYTVRIVDEMGQTAVKTFRITFKLNTPALILIIIAAVVLILFVVFIIFSRTRVKVR